MAQKGLAPIIIVLLIAAAIGGYLVYSGKINLNQTTTQVTQPSPTPDEIANWKTYTNTKYGYSFSYPNNWLEPTTYEADWFTDTTLSNGISIRIIKWVGPAWKDLKAYFDEIYHNPNNQKTTLDDVAAVKHITESIPKIPSEFFYSINIYAYKNNLVYVVINRGRDKEEVENNTLVFSKILSTFKFTN